MDGASEAELEFKDFIPKVGLPSCEDDTPALVGQSEMPWPTVTPAELRAMVKELAPR
jgi:hypothetical protein